MKKILITGGAGFIGTNLIKSLINKYHIICVDNLLCSSYSNVEEFDTYNNFEFINEDIIGIKNIDCDFIFNLACPASPVWYSKYHIETIKTCTQGMFNILDIAIKNNAKLFHASTSEVYGDPNISPQNENYYGNVNSYGPRSCYDEGKRCAEAILYSYKKRTDFYIGRIFNTYGPFMQANDGRVISNFVNQAISNQKITVYGDGSQTRSFCFVDDMVKLLELLIDSDIRYQNPFNIGNPKEMQIKDIAEKIVQLSNSSSKIDYYDLPKDDPLQRRPDISLIEKTFSWKPKVELEYGLNETIKYFTKLKERF